MATATVINNTQLYAEAVGRRLSSRMDRLGLAIIDLTNPSNARIMHQIAFSNTTVLAVEVAGNLAFAGLAIGK